MKTLLITATLFSIFQISSAQNISGKATYLSKLKMEDQLDLEKQNIPEGLRGLISAAIKSETEKEYTLVFNSTESLFKEAEKVNNNISNNSGISVQTMVVEYDQAGGEHLYKNLKNSTYTEQALSFDKKFLITDSIPKINWVLTKETKHIGQYKCNKAYYLEEYKAPKSTTNLTEFETKTDTVVAWYSPQIPVSNGPKLLGGLPGFILEYSDSKEVFQCSEIVLNPKEKVIITKPIKGKKISAEAFEQLMDKKQKEHMEQINGLLDGNGNNFQIIIEE